MSAAQIVAGSFREFSTPSGRRYTTVILADGRRCQRDTSPNGIARYYAETFDGRLSLVSKANASMRARIDAAIAAAEGK